MKIFNGVEKLIVGKVYTYPQLCELFGEDRKSGNSKIAQLNEWECYFRWTKINAQQYRIEEVYDIPKERIDKRKKNSGKATGKFYEIDDLLMEFLEEEEKKTVETTVPKLAVELGIMSERTLSKNVKINS